MVWSIEGSIGHCGLSLDRKSRKPVPVSARARDERRLTARPPTVVATQGDIRARLFPHCPSPRYKLQMFTRARADFCVEPGRADGCVRIMKGVHECLFVDPVGVDAESGAGSGRKREDQELAGEPSQFGETRVGPKADEHTLIYASQTSRKKFRIPSSCLCSCNIKNLISVARHKKTKRRGQRQGKGKSVRIRSHAVRRLREKQKRAAAHVLTAGNEKSRGCPFVDTVDGFEVPVKMPSHISLLAPRGSLDDFGTA